MSFYWNVSWEVICALRVENKPIREFNGSEFFFNYFFFSFGDLVPAARIIKRKEKSGSHLSFEIAKLNTRQRVKYDGVGVKDKTNTRHVHITCTIWHFPSWLLQLLTETWVYVVNFSKTVQFKVLFH